MATALDLISGSLRLLGAIAPGEVPSGAEGADGLTALNDLIESWNIERLQIPAIQRTTHTLTIGLNPHTIGTSGTFNTTRPVKIENAGLMLSGSSIEHPLHPLTEQEWAEIVTKAQSGQPGEFFYRANFPLGAIYLNPVPSAADTLVLYTWTPLSSVAALATTLAFAPGYNRALRYNLAVEIASEYGRPLPQDVLAIAIESKGRLKSLNEPTQVAVCDAALVYPPVFDINAG